MSLASTNGVPGVCSSHSILCIALRSTISKILKFEVFLKCEVLFKYRTCMGKPDYSNTLRVEFSKAFPKRNLWNSVVYKHFPVKLFNILLRLSLNWPRACLVLFTEGCPVEFSAMMEIILSTLSSMTESRHMSLLSTRNLTSNLVH